MDMTQATAGRVPIIIPRYNDGENVIQCIQSVWEKTTGDYRLIVADDCSDRDDAGLKWLRAMRLNKKLELTESKERGWLSGNFNRVIKDLKITTDFVKLDSDVVVYSRGWLERMVDFMKEHPKCGELSAGMVTSDEPEAKIRYFPKTIKDGKMEGIYDWTPVAGLEPVSADIVPGPLSMFRYEAFKELDGFDEKFKCDFIDADYCMRLRKAGWEVWYHPQIWANHLCHSKGRDETGFREASNGDRGLFKERYGVSW